MRLLGTALLVAAALTTAAAPAGAAPPTDSRGSAVQLCHEDAGRYGFSSSKECIQFVAKGGRLAPVARPELRVVEGDQFPLFNGQRVDLTGTGLLPGSAITLSYDYVSLAGETVRESEVIPTVAGPDGTFASDVAFSCNAVRTVDNVTISGTSADGQPIRSNELDGVCPLS